MWERIIEWLLRDRLDAAYQEGYDFGHYDGFNEGYDAGLETAEAKLEKD